MATYFVFEPPVRAQRPLEAALDLFVFEPIDFSDYDDELEVEFE